MNNTIEKKIVKSKPKYLELISIVNIVISSCRVLLLFILISFGKWDNLTRSMGQECLDLITLIAIPGLLGLISFIGLLNSKLWGWWLCTFYCIDRGLFYLYYFITVIPLSTIDIYIGFLCKSIFYMILVIYLFSTAVLNYFGREPNKRLNYCIIFSGVCIAKYIIFYILERLVV